MKKYLFIISGLLFLFGCSNRVNEEYSSDETDEEKEMREERTMSTDDIPPFANQEAEDYYFKGNDARVNEDYESARDFYLKSYKADPKHMVNLNNLANCYLVLRDVANAEKYFNIALETDPDFGMTYANYTNFGINTKDYSKGIKTGRTGLLKITDSTYLGIININLSILYAYQDNCDSAKYFLEQTASFEKYLNENALAGVTGQIYSMCE